MRHVGSLAPWLRGLRELVIDAQVADSDLAERARRALAHLPWRVRGPGEEPPRSSRPGEVLHLTATKGRFLKPCPGTKRYRCCGYKIINIGENCPLTCSYCVLKGYFPDRTLRVFANTGRLFAELDKAFARRPDKRFRVGTGEFTDSLALEPVTGLARDLVSFLAGYANVVLELKSKIVDLSWLDAARPGGVLPAWSLNARKITTDEEPGSASPEERLAAARTCARAGFRVCLHFDPIVSYPGWEAGYDAAVDMIFDYLRPSDIAYVSLGSFRAPPPLFAALAGQDEPPGYLFEEFVTGLDGKKRLLRPLRVAQLARVAARLAARGLDRGVYLCMESDTVWRAVFGYTPARLGGLTRHLGDLAFDGGRR